MKKLIFASLAGSILLLVAADGAFAQNQVSTEAMEPQIQKSATGSAANEMEGISPKALKNFTKSFKEVYGESWEKIDHGFSAKFISNGVQTRVYYDPRGGWTGSLKGYTEDKMARNIRDIVKREYYDYSITYVQEVETLESEGIPTYVIHVEDSTNIKLLRIHNGEMSVWKAYKKQS